MAPERIQELWQQFTKAFVGASATVILGGIVAFVGGVFSKIDHIISSQAQMSWEIKALSIKVDERDRSTQEAITRGAEKDATLNMQLNQFGEQHLIMMKEINRVKDVLEGKRR